MKFKAEKARAWTGFKGACALRTAALALGLALCAPTLASAQTEHAFLETLMSAPFAEKPAVAPVSDMVAWKEIQNGAHTIWVARAPDFTPVMVAEFPEDDGQPIRRLTFDPTEEYVYFVRGNGRMHHGFSPNPEHLYEIPERVILRVPVDGGEIETVADAGSFTFNPATGALAFPRRGGMVEITAEELAEGDFDAETLFRVRGGAGSFSWSPDGERALFIADRTSHSFIGIFDTDTDHIEWIAPDVTRDIYPVWSPDSSQIAFIRAPGKLTNRYFDYSDAWDFSIMVHDVETGETRTAWEAPDAYGSLFEWWRTMPLLWAGNDTLIFSSENDGWLRNYRLDVNSGEIEPLTETGCELFDNTDRADDGIYIASTNCADSDLRNFTLYDLNTGESEQLTSGGVEVEPIRLASGTRLIYAATTDRRPKAIYLRDLTNGETRQLSSLLGPDFPESELVTPVSVSFPSAAEDEAEIYGQLFMSDDPAFEGIQRPALVFLHGGPIRQMVAAWHPLNYYDRLYALNQYLAEQGYIVLSVNYRAGTGYGRDYRTVDGLGPAGALEYQDVLGGAAYLTAMDVVDADRIGIFGGSYGGYLTGLGLARNSDIFAAGVNIHGVHDWPAYAEESYGKGFDDGWHIFGDETVRIAGEASPVADLDTWTSPTLFIHGDADLNVEFRQTVNVVTRLRDLDRDVEVLVLVDEAHGFLREDAWRRANIETAEFFDAHLGDALP
ncbi:prolyl oligopeptidase family serine peptidase [Ponticaulis sp.]|uniref:S9 family peptidase n=1 Tax=Ponticaulis sp. TaxID=2020902 RepID=UPI000B69573E|nr:prolyl oligopeptidase family serine peptidase [Ponticaulis sp.]MAI91185.1 hypothetical protein [Ponticaulis sp.]OUX98499.1 MAG: hypothetical protein CBB65_12125 [Hyphomonadaceae bacterium TMED5]|tara:strand:+ start:106699 stop:108873 length:2175 start_codon:yes stop_codon:yes gene_type:complete